MCVLRDNHALNACKMCTSAGNSPSLFMPLSGAQTHSLSLCLSFLLGPSLVLVLSLTLNSAWLLKKRIGAENGMRR